MLHDKFSTLVAVVLLLCVTGASAVLAQSTDPAWLDDLSEQLASQLECEANYFVNIQEGQLGASRYYEARVQCLDGRLFDATRTEPDRDFLIRPCGKAIC